MMLILDNSFRNLKRIISDNILEDNIQELLIDVEFLWTEKPQNPLDVMLRLPTELHDFVFQHLEDEMLDLSIVSKTWFEFTKNIIVNNQMFDLSNDMNAPAKRKYCDFNATDNIIAVLELKENLLGLKIDNIDPESLIQVSSLFIRDTLQHLTFLNLSCNDTCPLDNLSFPVSLEILMLSNFSYLDPTPIETNFLNFLCRANRLRYLEFFSCQKLEKLFSVDISQFCSLQLQKLTLHINKKREDKTEIWHAIKENFCRFLQSQSNTLEVLNLGTVCVDTVCKLFGSFQLKSFGFDKLLGSTTQLKVPGNFMVNLRVPGSFDDVKHFIKLVPRLHSLHTRILTDELVMYAKNNLKELREIRYEQEMLEVLKSQVFEDSFEGIMLIKDDILYEEYDQSNNDIVY